MKHSILILLSSFALLLASACVTQKGVDKYYKKYPDLLQMRSDKFFNDHPDLLAKKCSEKYPVKETVIPGKPESDTTYEQGPAIQMHCSGKDSAGSIAPAAVVQCPPNKTIRTTVHDTIKIEDTAKLAAWRSEFSDSIKAHQARYLKEHDLRIKAELERDQYKTDYLLAKKIARSGAAILGFCLVGFIFIKRFF